MMSPAAAVAVALVSGLAVGVFFFGGLWWTVRRGTDSSAPALWFSASSLPTSSLRWAMTSSKPPQFPRPNQLTP